MKLRQKIAKAIREMPIEVRRFLTGRYPDFVSKLNNDPLGQQVPVFMFHSVVPELFENQLAFLKRNRYRTLTLEEFMAFLQGRNYLDSPSVVLTFDDGHKEWHEIAYPKLRAYGFHGVGFLVTNFIRRESGPGNWLSWPQVVEMERSGVFEFESHTARHDLVFVGPKLIDFFNPSFDDKTMGLDVPWIEDEGRYTNRLRWGTPIYSCLSRYAGKIRFLDDIGVRRACVEWVALQGGKEFFNQAGWRKVLAKEHYRLAGKRWAVRYESETQQEAGILKNLVEARQTMEFELGRPVRHLCYPWGEGSELAVSLSRDAGYISNFWVTHERCNTNRPGNSTFYIPRLKDDFIFRLPGIGRKTLVSIFIMKLCRRAMKLDIY